MKLNVELPQEKVKRLYEVVELSKKTGKIKKGVNETTKTVERGVAKLVVAASDVNPQEIIMHLPILCEEKNIPFFLVPSKEELGAAAGLSVSTAAIAIVQEGEAREAIKDLLKK